jgi:hypothetical protein
MVMSFRAELSKNLMPFHEVVAGQKAGESLAVILLLGLAYHAATAVVGCKSIRRTVSL